MWWLLSPDQGSSGLLLGTFRFLLRVASNTWSWILIFLERKLATLELNAWLCVLWRRFSLWKLTPHAWKIKKQIFWGLAHLLRSYAKTQVFFLGKWNFVRYIYIETPSYTQKKNCRTKAHTGRMLLEFKPLSFISANCKTYYLTFSWHVSHIVTFTPQALFTI